MRARKRDRDQNNILSEKRYDKAHEYVVYNRLVHEEVNSELRILVSKCMRFQIVRRGSGEKHFSVIKTERIVRIDSCFKNMLSKIEQVAGSFDTCILAEKKRGKPENFFNPISKRDVSVLPMDIYQQTQFRPGLKLKSKFLGLYHGFKKRSLCS